MTGVLFVQPARAEDTAVRQARLDVRITTTSDWTAVRIAPGAVLATRVTSTSPGVTVTPVAQGWVVQAPGGAIQTVQLSAVYEETSLAPTLTVSITKGFGGKTRLEVINTSNDPFPVLDVLDDVHDSATNSKLKVTVERLAFFGSVPPKHDADPRRLVLAFYYPWWSVAGYKDPALSDSPSHPRGVYWPASVLSMTQQAKAAGIDGFIVSWAGDVKNGNEFDHAVAAAEQTGSFVSVGMAMLGANVERDETAPPDEATVKQRIAEALERAASPAFLRSDDVPVVFVFDMGKLKLDAWKRVLAELASEGRPVRIVGDAPPASFDEVRWGYYRYDPNQMGLDELTAYNKYYSADKRLLSGRDLLWAATVSPGFNDLTKPELTVDRGADGERYAGTWEAALASEPDWVLITSWNEWYEGTSVEPSVKYGDTALRQTEQFATAFNGLTTAPVASDDAYLAHEDRTLTVPAGGVLANDVTAADRSPTATVVDGPSKGSLKLNPDGSFAYTPAANFNGTDAFTYRVTDGLLRSGIATVSIGVAARNDAPVASADRYTVSDKRTLRVGSPGLRANDRDADHDPLTVILVKKPKSGKLRIGRDGSFVYVPKRGYRGAVTFKYRVIDGALTSAPATVTIRVR